MATPFFNKRTRDDISASRAKTLRANMTKVATPNHLCLVNPTHTDLPKEQFFSVYVTLFFPFAVLFYIIKEIKYTKNV